MLSFSTLLATTALFASTMLSPQTCNHRATKSSSADFISKISYHSTGGRASNYQTLDISRDSLIYGQAIRGEERTVKQKTEKDFWNKLIQSINLKDFDKIRSNPGHALYDGIDVTIAIDEENGKHSIVNGQEDTVNYKKVKPFTDLLENKLEELRRK